MAFRTPERNTQLAAVAWTSIIIAVIGSLLSILVAILVFVWHFDCWTGSCRVPLLSADSFWFAAREAGVLAVEHVLIVMAVYYSRYRERAVFQRENESKGSAHWADLREIKETGMLDTKPEQSIHIGGVEVRNRIAYLGADAGHCMVVAPPGDHKTTGIAIPTLLQWEGSVFVTDIKGELFDLTAGHRATLGPVYRFDPASTKGPSDLFNPLAEVRVGTPHEIADVQEICVEIVHADHIESKKTVDHWVKTAAAALQGIIIHILYAEAEKTLRAIPGFLFGGGAETLDQEGFRADLDALIERQERDPDDPITIQDMTRLMAEYVGDNIQSALYRMLSTDHRACALAAGIPWAYGDETCHPVVVQSARELLAKASNELSGVISTLVSNTYLYQDPLVQMATSGSDFRAADIMHSEKPVTVYMIVPPEDQVRLRPIYRLFFSMVLRRNMRTVQATVDNPNSAYKHQLLMLLDEVQFFGKMADIQTTPSYSRGFGIRFLFMTQDMSLLRDIYGNDAASSLLSLCITRIFHGQNSAESAKMVSDMLGTSTIRTGQRTRTGNIVAPVLTNVMASEQDDSRALLFLNEVMSLPSRNSIIFTKGSAPIMGVKTPYYEDRGFRALASIPPPKPLTRPPLPPIATVLSQGRIGASGNGPDLPALAYAVREREPVAEVAETLSNSITWASPAILGAEVAIEMQRD